MTEQQHNRYNWAVPVSDFTQLLFCQCGTYFVGEDRAQLLRMAEMHQIRKALGLPDPEFVEAEQ